MSIKTIMRRVIIFENILGVYRNIHCFSKCIKFLAVVRVFAELILISFYFVRRLIQFTTTNTMSKVDDKIQTSAYIVMLLMNTYYIVLGAMYNGKYYNSMFRFIVHTENHLKNEPGYRKMMRALYIAIASYIGAWTIMFLFGGIPFISMFLEGYTIERKIFTFAIGLGSEGRLLLEDVVNASFLIVLSGSLECIAMSVRRLDFKIKTALEHEKKLIGRKSVLGTKYINLMLKHKTSCWVKNYEMVNAASVLAKNVFGAQIYFSVSFAVVYLTVMIYRYATRYLTKVEFEWSEWNVVLLMSHAMGIFTVAICGQKVKSEAIALRQAVTRLNLTLLSVPETTREVSKMVSHFLRVVCTEPVAVDVVFSLHIGMPLLPQFLCFATEWVVVGLQANHVI